MKNIIICLDGTWNKPSQDDDKSSEDNEETNVLRLYKLLEKSELQVTYYDEGVGSNWYDSIVGGISGIGLSRNIIQAYEFLCNNWVVGDNVFLFGFSRGAYTARSLAGMIYSCGLIKKQNNVKENIFNAFDVYKSGTKNERYIYKSTNHTCPIDTIGVWDTVGALGIPIELLKGINSKISQFHDTKINKEVKCAYHALALDEQRGTFTPTFWDESEKIDDQIIEQVWFSGVHSDIGGGYLERYYSDITLKWMMSKLQNKISFNNNIYNFSNHSLQEIHDSYKFYFGPRIVRSLPIYCDNYPCLHQSVVNSMLNPDYQCRSLPLVTNTVTLSPYRVVL